MSRIAQGLAVSTPKADQPTSPHPTFAPGHYRFEQVAGLYCGFVIAYPASIPWISIMSYDMARFSENFSPPLAFEA